MGLTKTQKKNLVKQIRGKTTKLFTNTGSMGQHVASVKDMEAIERLCDKWMKRINQGQ